ncbi:ribokinase [Klebsiella aerogenes]|uniref:ribokinase n=1 Tax=Klebsiella aerogenes TaxID=548 RepID=UPI001865DBA8|nr:ribokinase [Klebsiella aerogenes]
MKNELASGLCRYKSLTGKVFVLGSYNQDLVYTLKTFPETGQTVIAQGFRSQPGGKGSNQAIASMKAGGKTHFVTKIGDDAYSVIARTFLENCSFEDITLFRQENCPTGSAVVLVSELDEDNSIVVCPGANSMFTEEEIIACFPSISASDVMVIQLEINAEAIRLALEYASENNITTILNPAPYRDDVRKLLHLATYITPNITEAEEIVGYKIDSESMTEKAALDIYSMGAANVIITQGSSGCLLYDGRQFQYFCAFPAVSVDTSGAGDAFNGALAAMLARGEIIENAITYASAFSSLAVERTGASNMPEHQDVINKLNRHENAASFSFKS